MSDEWTSAERAAFDGLERTIEIDADEEERTVSRLRAEGLLGSDVSRQGARAGAARVGVARWGRPVRIGLAIAAGMACFLAGRWAERNGVLGRRDGIAARGAGEPHAVLADSQVRSPIIRF